MCNWRGSRSAPDTHFNDSGFWLVSRYLGLDEKQTLQSWMVTVVGLVGFGVVLAISPFL